VKRFRGGSGGSRSGGFTLLEVLLAFVVFALSFATVLEIVARMELFRGRIAGAIADGHGGHRYSAGRG
jgi:hypothetical protein